MILIWVQNGLKVSKVLGDFWRCGVNSFHLVIRLNYHLVFKDSHLLWENKQNMQIKSLNFTVLRKDNKINKTFIFLPHKKIKYVIWQKIIKIFIKFENCMTKPWKDFFFYITIAIFQDSFSSHTSCSPSGSSFPFVFLFPANTSPTKNWGGGRDLHQCLPQGIASKNYIEEKNEHEQKAFVKNLLQKKKKISIKKSDWNEN